MHWGYYLTYNAQEVYLDKALFFTTEKKYKW